MIEIINSIFNFIFGPILVLPPLIAETLVIIILMFIITLVSKHLSDQEKIREIKMELKSLQQKVKELQKSNPNEANNHLNQIMLLNNKLMKLNFKPMIISMFIFVLFFPWMSSVFLGKVLFTIPFLNITFGWLMWYLITSLIFSFLFRKILNVE